MLAVYGCVLKYDGRDIHQPVKKRFRLDLLQNVMQREVHGRFEGTKLRVIFATHTEAVALSDKRTAYIERSKPTDWLFDGRHVRRQWLLK